MKPLATTMATCCSQLMLAMTASLGYLTITLIRGWSSPGIPSMQLTCPHLIPSDAATSWVSAVPPLGAFCGSLVTGPFLHKLGRKKTLLISAPLFCLSWVIIGAATNTSMLIIGRLLSGFCGGIVMPSAQIYVSECSNPDIRGVLGSLPALFMAFGVLIAYIIGTWLPWDYLAFTSALFPAALFLFLLPLPESPSWLHSKGFKEAATKSAKWLRHERKGSVELPLQGHSATKDKINAFTNGETEKNLLSDLENLNSKGAYSAEELLRREVLVPFGLVVGILVLQQLSGIDIVLFYTVSIFEASGSFVNNYLATILVGLVQVLATAVSLFIIDHYGRKPLLLFSGVLMAASMAALGFYFYVHKQQYQIAVSLGLLPVISLMIFMGAFSLGFANVPFLLMGELLPTKQRSALGSVSSAFNLGSMFVVIKTYHDLKHWIGDYGVFSGCAIICVASCVFVLYYIPETKGKTLEEIEKYFKGQTSNLLVKEDTTDKI